MKRKRAIREELKIDFRYTPEEERRPPAVVLSGLLASTPAVPRERGRVGTPAVPRERGEISKRAAKAKGWWRSQVRRRGSSTSPAGEAKGQG